MRKIIVLMWLSGKISKRYKTSSVIIAENNSSIPSIFLNSSINAERALRVPNLALMTKSKLAPWTSANSWTSLYFRILSTIFSFGIRTLRGTVSAILTKR